MRLLISIDEHYVSRDGHIYSTEGTTPYDFFREYLRVFDEIIVLARVRSDEHFLGRSAAMSDGPNVEFHRLDDFHGPIEYLRLRNRIVAQVRAAVGKADVFLLRGPGTIGRLVACEVERVGRFYAAEVLGDPWSVFGPGRVGGPLRAVFRYMLTSELKRICLRATAVLYVTESFLQQRYPASPNAVVASCSDAQIGNALITEEELERKIQGLSTLAARPIQLGFVGSLQQPYKGADVLLNSVAICRSHGLDIRARLAGEGRLRSHYQRMAQQLDLGEYVQFVGRVRAGEAIFRFLDEITLFVMPSLTEGLPRAMVEAMARGCPSIGSNVGGIPELLSSEDLVPPGDATALANKIMQKVSSSSELAAMARRNHNKARNYRPERLQAARLAFLNAAFDRAFIGSMNTAKKMEPFPLAT